MHRVGSSIRIRFLSGLHLSIGQSHLELTLPLKLREIATCREEATLQAVAVAEVSYSIPWLYLTVEKTLTSVISEGYMPNWVDAGKVSIVLTALGTAGLANLVQWYIQRPAQRRQQEQLDRIEGNQRALIEYQLASDIVAVGDRSGPRASQEEGAELVRGNRNATDRVVQEYRRNGLNSEADRIHNTSRTPSPTASTTATDTRSALDPRRVIPARPRAPDRANAHEYELHPSLARTWVHHSTGWLTHPTQGGGRLWLHTGSTETNHWHS